MVTPAPPAAPDRRARPEEPRRTPDVGTERARALRPGGEARRFRLRATAVGEIACAVFTPGEREEATGAGDAGAETATPVRASPTGSGRSTGGRVERILTVRGPSAWIEAAGQILWIGPGTVPLHPRAITADVPAVERPDDLEVDVAGATVWRPPAIPGGAAAARALVGGAGCLITDLARAGASSRAGHPWVTAARNPTFGPLLAGGVPADPLHRAVDSVRRLAGACGADDPVAALEAARSLLGLGPGLTPSGDDVVGGAFFARRILAGGGMADGEGWAQAGRRLHQAAHGLTHPISAALLGDMLGGQTWGPLHSLLSALSRGAPAPVVRQSVSDLTGIGGTSGWDLLVGTLAGLLGERAFPGLG